MSQGPRERRPNRAPRVVRAWASFLWAIPRTHTLRRRRIGTPCCLCRVSPSLSLSRSSASYSTAPLARARARPRSGAECVVVVVSLSPHFVEVNSSSPLPRRSRGFSGCSRARGSSLARDSRVSPSFPPDSCALVSCAARVCRVVRSVGGGGSVSPRGWGWGLGGRVCSFRGMILSAVDFVSARES